MAAQGLAVHKLGAEEVFVPNIKAAEDLNFTPFLAAATATVSKTLLQAPNQPPDITSFQLLVLSIRWREPKSTKPGIVKIVQVMGNFLEEIFEMLVFR